MLSGGYGRYFADRNVPCQGLKRPISARTTAAQAVQGESAFGVSYGVFECPAESSGEERAMADGADDVAGIPVGGVEGDVGQADDLALLSVPEKPSQGLYGVRIYVRFY